MSSITLEAPFPRSCALNTDSLCLRPKKVIQHISPPSDQAADDGNYLPGCLAVTLVPDMVYAYLIKELNTPLLDELYTKLWLVGRRSGGHIDALHSQRVKGRAIVPTEDPRLHLIWDHTKVYIKPVPIFLLNYDFWAAYLSSAGPSPAASSKSATMAFDRSTAVGFLRSYSFLVSHPLDLAIAHELHLVSRDIDWTHWSQFIRHFCRIGDDSVARRYHYGQLRLSRLNWVVRIFRPKHAPQEWFYELPYRSINDFIAAYTVSLVFIFATLSLVLSSMQVALSVPADALWFDGSSDHLQGMSRSFWVFAVMVVLLWIIIWGLLLGIPLLVLVWQVSWGYQNRELPKRQGGSVA